MQPPEGYLMEVEILCFLSFFMPCLFEEVTLLWYMICVSFCVSFLSLCMFFRHNPFEE